MEVRKMLGKCIGAAGIIIALIAIYRLIGLLELRSRGVTEEVEVVRSREVKPNVYAHTLRFPDGSEREDKAGFNRPFSDGKLLTVVSDPKNRENFEFAEQLRKNIYIMGALLGMAVLFMVRGFLM
jgi:hypothetical protein